MGEGRWRAPLVTFIWTTQLSLNGPLWSWWWPRAVTVQIQVAGGWQVGINQRYIKIVRMAGAPVKTERGIDSKGPLSS